MRPATRLKKLRQRVAVPSPVTNPVDVVDSVTDGGPEELLEEFPEETSSFEAIVWRTIVGEMQESKSPSSIDYNEHQM